MVKKKKEKKKKTVSLQVTTAAVQVLSFFTAQHRKQAIKLLQTLASSSLSYIYRLPS